MPAAVTDAVVLLQPSVPSAQDHKTRTGWTYKCCAAVSPAYLRLCLSYSATNTRVDFNERQGAFPKIRRDVKRLDIECMSIVHN